MGAMAAQKPGPKLLKWSATFLVETLADLFNNFLAAAVLPGYWKTAVICPIFKKGDPEGVASYYSPDPGCV